jgi:MSHA biogenesis protein MshO
VTVAAGDQLVVYNLGLPGADAYSGESRRSLTSTGAAVTRLVYTLGGSQFPYASPGSRFQIVSTPVTYVCAEGNLRRLAGYAIQSSQPVSLTAAPLLSLTGRNKTLLANKVASCSFAYSNTAAARSGLVTVRLTLTSGVDVVALVSQVRVDNSP